MMGKQVFAASMLVVTASFFGMGCSAGSDAKEGSGATDEALEGEHCGGTTFHRHTCRPGFFCDFTGMNPDVGGVCRKLPDVADAAAE